MAARQNIYSIYKIPNELKYYILKTTIPDFNNTSQNQEDDAIGIEIESRKKMLRYISALNNQLEPDLIGELQNFPLGEELYSDVGNKEVNLFYMETQFGYPWVVMGTADSEEAFVLELSEDDESMDLKPTGKPKNVTAWFLTENDIY